MTKQLKNPTVLFGFALFILGIYMLKQSLHWGVYGPEGPGPGFFPLIYGLITTFFSAILVIQTVQVPRAEPSRPQDPAEKAGSRAAVVTWLGLMLSVPLMAWFGFIVGFGCTLFFLVRVVFQRSALSSAVVAALIVLGLYLGFDVLLGLPLPTAKYWSF